MLFRFWVMLCASALGFEPARVETRAVELYALISLKELQLIPWKKGCAVEEEKKPVSPIKLGELELQSCDPEKSVYPPDGESCALLPAQIFYPTPTWRRRVLETWQGEDSRQTEAALRASLTELSRKLSQDCVANGGEAFWSRPKILECREQSSEFLCSGWLWALCEARDY
jgi:hypothetical protein